MLEALSEGLPVVCLDHQGARHRHERLRHQDSRKFRQVVEDCAGHRCLAREPEERMRLSQGALERARHYLWSRQETHGGHL